MKRLVTVALTSTFTLACMCAGSRSAGATPPYDVPAAATLSALDRLAADGVLVGYRDRTLGDDRPQTRAQVARLVARALAKARRDGSSLSDDDRTALRRLVDSYRDELTLLGVHVADVRQMLAGAQYAAPATRSFEVNGELSVDESSRQRTAPGSNVAGGPIDPLVNAYLTSPADNSPFEHDPGAGSRLRFDAKIDPTYTVNENLALSLPIHVIQYDKQLSANDNYLVQPALVLNVAKFGGLQDAYVRIGQLDDLESSRLGLTYRAPDATEQGPGFQNPVQPYEYGIAVGGTYRDHTQFQVGYSQIDDSAINSFFTSGDLGSYANYFLVVAPQQYSAIQRGQGNPTGGASHTDSFSATAGPISSVFLTMKAAVGSVYISAVDGTVCTPGGTTPMGAVCPIAPGSWYYIDKTNQVVFPTPLPAGAIVQITYSTSGSAGSGTPANYGLQREHFTARVNQSFSGLPGTEVGLSFSRIIDASYGAPYASGFGAVSDRVVGLDARIPLSFIPIGGLDRAQRPVLFAEGAYSSFTPNLFVQSPITDSASVVGIRFHLAAARADVKFQNVGPNFLDGSPVQYLGPAPPTAGYLRGNYFPGFFGFANNAAINQTFQSVVTPGCAGQGCVTRNPANTYIYPVFNPFVAGGPEYFSAYAPNSRGLSAEVVAPFGDAAHPVELHLIAQHLREVEPNGAGQMEYGPGFASGITERFDKLEGALGYTVPILDTDVCFTLVDGVEHLYRGDSTAYAYVPFNAMTGAADAGSTAALNAYLNGGATPILFYPNYVDERHTTFAPGFSLSLAHGFTVGMIYDVQAYYGTYGLTLGQDIAERKVDALLTASYTFPHRRSILSLLLGNERYTDLVLPVYNFNQNREALDFTTRF